MDSHHVLESHAGWQIVVDTAFAESLLTTPHRIRSSVMPTPENNHSLFCATQCHIAQPLCDRGWRIFHSVSMSPNPSVATSMCAPANHVGYRQKRNLLA